MNETITKQIRFNQLHLALQYCTDKKGYFTEGERICINQERGKLLDYVHEINFTDDATPQFPHEPILTNKIDFVIEKITNTNWLPKPILFSKYGV